MVSSTEISLYPDHWQPADVYHPNHQRTHDKVLDMPFPVPTAPIKGIWYLDGSTVGTDNA